MQTNHVRTEDESGVALALLLRINPTADQRFARYSIGWRDSCQQHDCQDDQASHVSSLGRYANVRNGSKAAIGDLAVLQARICASGSRMRGDDIPKLSK